MSTIFRKNGLFRYLMPLFRMLPAPVASGGCWMANQRAHRKSAVQREKVQQLPTTGFLYGGLGGLQSTVLMGNPFRQATPWAKAFQSREGDGPRAAQGQPCRGGWGKAASVRTKARPYTMNGGRRSIFHGKGWTRPRPRAGGPFSRIRMGDGRQRPGRRRLRFPPGGAPRLLQACGDGRIKRDGGEGARPSFSGRRKAFQNHMGNRSGALLRMHMGFSRNGLPSRCFPTGQKSLGEEGFLQKGFPSPAFHILPV